MSCLHRDSYYNRVEQKQNANLCTQCVLSFTVIKQCRVKERKVSGGAAVEDLTPHYVVPTLPMTVPFSLCVFVF